MNAKERKLKDEMIKANNKWLSIFGPVHPARLIEAWTWITGVIPHRTGMDRKYAHMVIDASYRNDIPIPVDYHLEQVAKHFADHNIMDMDRVIDQLRVAVKLGQV